MIADLAPFQSKPGTGRRSSARWHGHRGSWWHSWFYHPTHSWWSRPDKHHWRFMPDPRGPTLRSYRMRTAHL